MALNRKKWIFCIAGSLLLAAGITGGLLYRAEMKKRPAPSPLGGTVRTEKNVLYLTDAVFTEQPDWEALRRLLRDPSLERAEIGGTVMLAGQSLPIQRGEMHKNPSGTWDIVLESLWNRSPLLLSGTADPVRETFSGKYAAALSPREWSKHPFFGALKLHGIARTRGNLMVIGSKITLLPTAAMPDEGTRIFAGPLELEAGQEGVTGDGKTISLPGGAISLPPLRLQSPQIRCSGQSFSFSAKARWKDPVRMAQDLSVQGTISADGQWSCSAKIPEDTLYAEPLAFAKLSGGELSGEGNGSTGLLRITAHARSSAGSHGSWHSGATRFRRDWRFRPDQKDAAVLQQTAITFDRWTGEENTHPAAAEQMELTLDNSKPGEMAFRLTAKTLTLREMTLHAPRISGVITPGKTRQGSLTLTASAVQFRHARHTLSAGAFRAEGTFSGHWRNGTWQIHAKDAAGQWGPIAYLAPELSAEMAPDLTLLRASLPHAALTFAEGGCDLSGGVITPDTIQAESLSGHFRGWKFQVSAFRRTPDLLQWRDGKLSGNGIALQAAALDTAAGTFSARAAQPGSWADAVTASASLQKDLLTLRGKSTSGLFQSGGFFFHGSVSLRDPAGSLRGEFTLPAATLRHPLPLQKLAPAGKGWALAGKLSCAGTVSAEKGTLCWNPAWSFEGSAANDGGTLEKMLFQLTGKGLLEGVAGSFRSGRMHGSDVEIAVDLSGKTPLLQRLSFALWSGNWQWDPAADLFHIRNLSPEGLLSLPEWQQSLSGTFRGEGRIRWGADGMSLQKLDAFSENTAHWKLGKMERFRYVPTKGIDPELFGFAAALANDFLARRTALTLEVLAGGTLVQLRGEGRPAAPVPYVFDGKSLRPARPGDHGFSTAVELDCDYWIPAGKP